MKGVIAVDSSKDEPLTWEVFETPGIPILTPDRPADVREAFFQAMASTLIYGRSDALLVDAFMTTSQANSLSLSERARRCDAEYGHGDAPQCGVDSHGLGG